MSGFSDLCYVNAYGLAAPIDPSHPDNPQYEAPCNAVVINPDASLNHQVIAPELVALSSGEAASTGEKQVMGIAEVLTVNDRIVIGLHFDRQWVERRYYDPATRQWQERDQIYRN